MKPATLDLATAFPAMAEQKAAVVDHELSLIHIQTESTFLASRDNQEVLLQWNLNECLVSKRFLFSGPFISATASDYDILLRAFFQRGDCLAAVGVNGLPSSPTVVDSNLLSTSIMSMDFFDRINDSDIATSSGSIRGCFDEVFDGITVGDKLREFLLNQDSENEALFSKDERNQLIFQLLKLFAVGGSMCQADENIRRSPFQIVCISSCF